MLTLEEAFLINRLDKQRMKAVISNEEKYKYYYQHLMVKDLGISTPPRLAGLNCTLGWAATSVDVIEERIKFTGFYSPTNQPEIEQLNKLLRENDVEVIQRAFLKDALITGTSFLSIGVGSGEFEPAVIFRAESPNEMTGDYNFRTRILDNALKVVRVGADFIGTLWLPNETIQIKKLEGSELWQEVERDTHNLGHVTVVTIINEQDSKYPRGRSEITPALRSHIDAGQRIILGTEISREFFSAPLRAIVGATPDMFLDEDGNPLNPWDLITGKFIALPAGEEGGATPSITQLPVSDPGQIMNLLEKFAVLAAREMGLAPSYLGFETVNPTSQDAMAFSDMKLLHKVYKRQPEVARAWKLASKYAQLLLNGKVMDGFEDVEATFMRAEAPSPAAAADRISKLFAAGVFDKELPDFIYRDLGFREVEILQLKQWLQNNAGADLVKSLLAQNTPPAQPAPVAPVQAGN